MNEYLFNIEYQKKIIKYILQENAMMYLAFLSEDLFDTPELKEIYRFIQQWVERNLSIPEYDTILHECGGLFNKEDEVTPDKEKIIEIVNEIKQTPIIAKDIRIVLADFIKAQQLRHLLIDMSEDFQKGLYNVDDYRKKLDKLYWSTEIAENKNTITYLDIIKEEESNPGIKCPTGFPELDWMTKGIEPCCIWVIEASTSIGKTTLALNLSYNLCRAKHPVTILSTEMPVKELMRRLITMISGVNPSLKDSLNKPELKSRKEAAKLAQSLPIQFYYVRSLSDIRTHIMRGKSELYVVDHIQSIISTTYQNFEPNRLGNITRELARYSKIHKVCIIATSQQNRQAPEDPSKYGNRGSGEIEEGSDIEMGLYSDSRIRSVNKTTMKLIIKKNRYHGLMGKIKLEFDPNTMRFRELEQKKVIKEKNQKCQKEKK